MTVFETANMPEHLIQVIADSLLEMYARACNEANDLADAYRATLPTPAAVVAAVIDPADEANALSDAYRFRPVEGPGVFIVGENVYRVFEGRESGKLYAKRLVGETFEYAPGVIRDLTEAHRVTLEQAKALGRETGICAMCGRTLVDPVSIAGGIGPICEGRWFGKTARKTRKAAAKAAPAAVACADGCCTADKSADFPF